MNQVSDPDLSHPIRIMLSSPSASVYGPGGSGSERSNYARPLKRKWSVTIIQEIIHQQRVHSCVHIVISLRRGGHVLSLGVCLADNDYVMGCESFTVMWILHVLCRIV